MNEQQATEQQTESSASNERRVILHDDGTKTYPNLQQPSVPVEGETSPPTPKEEKKHHAMIRRNDIIDRNEAKRHLQVVLDEWNKQMHRREANQLCEYCGDDAQNCYCHKELAQAFMEFRFMNPLFK